MHKNKILIALASLLLASCGGGESPAPLAATPAPKLLAGTTNTVLPFQKSRASYTISKDAQGYTVTDTSSGIAILAGASKTLKFQDVDINLEIQALAQDVLASDLKLLIELYIAYFNRLPEADGLSYWIGRLKGGASLDSIAEDFYGAAIQYASLTGYSQTMSARDFVLIIYRNVLGRSGSTAPSAAEIDYWVQALDSGRSSRGTLIKTMLASAHRYAGDATWGWVPSLLENKYFAAHYLAVQHGITYKTAEESITKTMALATSVSASGIASAVAQIGIADTPFTYANPVILNLDYGGFTLNYDCVGRTALRYEYRLAHDSGYEARPSSYYSDPELPSFCRQQLSTGSYASIEAGWDRGHLVTSNHMDASAPWMRRANYMVNIAPQVSTFNQGIWVEAEEVAECYRDIAPVQVYGGVAFTDAANDKFLASHGLKTPDFFWKAIVTTGTNGESKAIAWYIPNQGSLGKLDSYIISIAELESRLGALSVGITVPASVKAQQPAVAWPKPAGCNLS